MERPDDYESITTLNISHKNLTELPSWISECKNLKILDCSWNNIMHLSNLPQTLENLFCWYNNITQINNLPPTLVKLYCSHNHITQLDNLPISLKILYCNEFLFILKMVNIVKALIHLVIKIIGCLK